MAVDPAPLWPGDILLERDATVLGWICRQATAAPVNHCLVVARDGQSVIEATRRGVVRSRLPQLTQTFGEGGAQAQYCVLHAPQSIRERAAEIAEGFLGDGYGYCDYGNLGLRLFCHHLLQTRSLSATYRGRLICSTLAVVAWRLAGYDPCPGLPDQLVTPGDLALALLRRGQAVLP